MWLVVTAQLCGLWKRGYKVHSAQAGALEALSKRAAKKAHMGRSSRSKEGSFSLIPSGPAPHQFRLMGLPWVLWIPDPFASLPHQGIPHHQQQLHWEYTSGPSQTWTLQWGESGVTPLIQGRNMGTRAYLPAAQGRNASREFPSPETGAVCLALGTERKGGNWPFNWNFCSRFFPGRKKKRNSEAILASFSPKPGQSAGSQGEVTQTSDPLLLRLFPQRLCHMVLFCMRCLPQPPSGPPSLSGSHPLTVFLSPSPQPHTLLLPFPPPHQALLWFLMISPLFNHSGETGPKIENKRVLTWMGNRPARTTSSNNNVRVAIPQASPAPPGCGSFVSGGETGVGMIVKASAPKDLIGKKDIAWPDLKAFKPGYQGLGVSGRRGTLAGTGRTACLAAGRVGGKSARRQEMGGKHSQDTGASSCWISVGWCRTDGSKSLTSSLNEGRIPCLGFPSMFPSLQCSEL